MKQNLISILALAVAVGTAGLGIFMRPAKIGYAETSVLLSEFSEAVKARQEFERAQEEWDKNIKNINDSLLAAMERLKTSYEKAKPREKEALSRDLNRWNADLNRYTQATRKMAEEKERALMAPVLDKMNRYMKSWGEKRGYDLIFGTTSGGNILQADAAYNVTSLLLKDLNVHYSNLPPSTARVDSLSENAKTSLQSAATPNPGAVKQ